MSIGYVVAAYVAVNSLLVVLVLVRSPANPLSRFFAFCVACLVILGGLGVPIVQPPDGPAREWIADVLLFCYALLPSFFLHFIVIFSRQHQILKSRGAMTAIYAAGFFSYAMLLLGWIPGPIRPDDSMSDSGFIFFIIWMSVFLSIGVAIAANKVDGVRAANVTTPEFAALSREHNDANVVALSARFVPVQVNEEILDAFLSTEFGGARHANRVAKITAAERS